MKIDGLKKIREQADEGAVVVIYDPDGEPYLASDGTEATMTIVGAESKRYRSKKLDQQRALIKKMRAGAGASSMTPEGNEQQVHRLAASAIIAWHGWEDDQGAAQECTVDNICKVIKYVHIMEQVAVVIQGHAGFFGKDSGS